MSRTPRPAASTPASTFTSGIRLVWSSPLYRGATIALFLSGLGTSAAAPQIALFLVNDLGASLPTAGLFYLTNLTAPIAGYLIGSRSDRTGRRLSLFRLCAVLGFVGWLGMALATQVWIPFVISAVILAIAGASSAQLFAAIHDDVRGLDTDKSNGVVSIVRMALTAGWVVGPVLGSFVAASVGARWMLVLTAVCTLAQILPLGRLKERSVPDRPPAPTGSAKQRRRAHGPGMLALLAFTGLYALVYAGEPIKYAYLPIYMNDQLNLAPAVSGAVIGIQPLVELLLMPVSIWVARRTGAMWLMVIGAGFAVAANIFFATVPSAAGMFAGQILMGGVWGIFAALGIIVAQRLLPFAVATAGSIFMSSSAFSSALGGLTGAVGVAKLGLPAVFFLPALCAGLAVVGLAVMAWTETRATRSPRPSAQLAAE